MQLTPDNIAELARIAQTAAQKSGALIAEQANSKLTIKNKASGTSEASQVLTEVDLMSQTIILEALKPTCQQYDLALLSEEHPDDGSRLEHDYFWCIDPLDGTLPFTEHVAGYAVSIALVAQDGTPLIGVVFDPVTQTCYHAIKGEGAYRNNTPWHVGPQKAGSPLTLLADRSFMKHPNIEEMKRSLQAIADEEGSPHVEIIAQGGAAMNAIWTVERAPAGYFKLPKPTPGGGSLWDFAATACILPEAGAIATNIHGTSLDLNRPDSTFMNHQGVLYASHQGLAVRLKSLKS